MRLSDLLRSFLDSGAETHSWTTGTPLVTIVIECDLAFPGLIGFVLSCLRFPFTEHTSCVLFK